MDDPFWSSDEDDESDDGRGSDTKSDDSDGQVLLDQK
jgi:hypothetical protein